MRTALIAALFFTLLIPFTPSLAASPPPPNACYLYGDFEAGTKVFPLFTAFAVGAEPSLTAKPIAWVTLADPPLTILSKTTKTATFFGVRENFYKVRIGAGAKAKSGYIYGGFLAKSQLAADMDGDGTRESIRIGWRSRGTSASPSGLPLAVACVIKAGKVVASVPFEPIGLVEGGSYGYNIWSKSLGSAGLSGGARLIRVRFEYAACDYPSGDVLLTYANGKLRVGLTTLESGNEQGSVSSRYIFPSDKGGKPDRVTVVETTAQYSEAGKLLRRSEQRKQYVWEPATGTLKVAPPTVARR